MIGPRQQHSFARHFSFDRGVRRYWLVEGTIWLRGAYLPCLDWNTGRHMLRSIASAVTSDAESGLRQFYANLQGRRGVPPSMPLAELVDLLVEALRVGRLHLYDLGSYDIALAGHIEGTPYRGTAGTPQQVAKIANVVGGLVTVAIIDINKQREAVFAEFKSELTKSTLLVDVMRSVISTWIAGQNADRGGFVVDPLLLGLLISLIGSDAFGWIEDLAGLLVAIDKAETEPALRRCTITLANLMIEIGVAGFITLLLGATGVKVTRT